MPDKRQRRLPSWLESLEDRTLLSLSIPASVVPTQATPILFAGDATQESLPAGAPTTLWEFSLSGATSPASIEFDLSPTSTTTQAGALALYDADGNLLTAADTNSNPAEPGVESLVAPAQSGQVYILGIFRDPSGPQSDFQLNVTPDPQNINAPLTASTSTGAASLAANSGQTLFQSPADVEVYPIGIPNGGATGSVVVTAADPNAGVDATLFRRDNAQSPWVPIASQSGTGALTLGITPGQGENIADSEFQLAVAPLNFAVAAGAYQVNVASAVLAPTSVDPTTAVPFSSVSLPTPGTVQYASADPLAGSARLYEFEAQTTGLTTITLDATGFAPLMSVYDDTGTNLLQVRSLTAPGTLSFQTAVTAGSVYLLRVDGVGGSPNGTTQLTVDSAYTVTPLPLSAANVGTAANVSVGPTAGSSFFQVAPGPGFDVLAVEVDGAAPSAAIEVSLVAPGLAPMSVTGTAGQPVYLPATINGESGPFDIAISSATSSGPLTVQVGVLDIPIQIAIASLPSENVDLTGHLAQPLTLPGGFGQSAGLKFYQYLSDPSAATSITIQGSNGARPVLARYEDVGGFFTLVDFATPNAQGLATLDEPLVAQARQGIMAFSIGFGGSGSPAVQVAVAAPKPVPTQVGMAPNNPPPLPSKPNAPVTQPFESQLKIDDVTLNADYQQQLYQTMLPYNLVFNAANLPVLTFTPSTPQSGLEAQVTIYNASTLAPIATAVSTAPGQTLSLPLYTTAAQMNALVSATLLILVQPVSAHLGDGIYSLDMNVQTTDPRPFLVTQSIWQFTPSILFGPKPLKGVADLNPNTSVGLIPFGVKTTDILQNQEGNGTAVGQFTSSNPASAGSYAVYRFWTMTPGPIIVRTVALQISPTDPIVNTSLRVYRGLDDANGQFFLDTLEQVLTSSSSTTNAVTGDFNWYPASNTPLDAQSAQNQFPTLNPDDPDIDSQVYINNSTVVTQGDPKGNTYGNGGGAYYIVVRNQGGSLGKYQVQVSVPSFPMLGGTSAGNAQITQYRSTTSGVVTALNNQLTYLDDANGGSTTLHLNYVSNFTDFVGYFPIELSADSQGPLTIATPQLALNDTLWDFTLFNATGQEIPGTSTDDSFGFAKNTSATFQVPAGAQVVYLRAQVRAGDPIPNDDAQFTLATTLSKANTIQPPPTTFPATETPVMFPTDPMGNAQQTAAHNGALVDAFSIFDMENSYTFNVGAGPIAVTLAPETAVAAGGLIRFGVYAGSTLLDWGVAAVASPTTLNVILPLLRQPTDDSADYGYDRSTYQQVTVRVDALSTFAIGTYALSVKTSAAYPMQNQVAQINPLTGSLAPIQTTGMGWTLLQVPEGSVAPLDLFGVGSNVAAGGETIHYDLYDFAGNFVAAGQQQITAAQPVATFQISQVTGGASYFLRIGLVDRPTVFIKVTAGISLPKASGSSAKPAASINLASESVITSPVNPDGTFDFDVSSAHDQAFWVDQNGVATFSLTDGLANSFLALYRLDYTGHGEDINEWALDLVDYLNRTNVSVGHTYNLTADLEPGTYVLKVAPNVGALLGGSLPAYLLHPLVVDPSTGSAEYPNLEGVDFTNGRANPVDAYRTTFYEVVAPAGATGLFQAKAKLLQTEDSYIGGQAQLSVYTNYSNSFLPVLPQPSKGDQAVLSDPAHKGDEADAAQITDSTAAPFQKFYIGVQRQFAASQVAVTADFDVPASGTPDLVIEPIVLTPDQGQTLVTITIINNGYGKAGATMARYAFSDAAQPASLQWTTSTLNEDSLGPLGTRTRTFIWNPVTENDVVEYTTDLTKSILETDYTNNGPSDINTAPNGADPRILKEVDTGPPSLTISLADPKVEGPKAAQNVWGRYISTVSIPTSIVFNFTDPLGPSNLWSAYGHYPSIVPQVKSTVGMYLSQIYLYNDPQIVVQDYDLGQLLPTAPDNTNQINMSVTDQWGLTSAVSTVTLNVVPLPGWLTNSESTVKFNKKTDVYDIHFHHTIINEEGTLDDLLNTSLPLVGDKQNQLLADVDAVTTASLDATKPVVAPITAQAKLELLGSTIFDEKWKGNASPVDHFTISTNVQIDPATVEANFFEITFALTNLPIANFASPEIPLFAWGVPGIADIEADLQFLFQASLSAATTIAINPNATTAADFLGLASPTYVGPTATVGAKVSGNVKVLGFDIASLSGTVDVQLNLDYGLTTPHDQFVPFDQFFNDSGFKVSGDLYGELEADFLGIKVWSYTTPQIQLFSSGNVVTNAMTAQGSSPDDDPNEGTETIPSGSAPLGPLTINPDPQMVVDPRTGQTMYVQVVNAGTTGNPQGNLAFEERAGGNWSSLTTIPESSYVTNPVLAEANDGTGDLGAFTNVVVYQAADLPPNVTRSQYFAAQGIRYRYFNGRTWGPEQTFTTDDGNDSEPALSFNNRGQGVVAWVHNTDPNPLGDNGDYDSAANEIEVAVWNKATHSFSTPVALSHDTVDSSQPTVVAGSDGTLRVEWLSATTGGGNQIMYSTYNGTQWSAPAPLPTTGLPQNGVIQDIALGQDGAGNIHTLIAERTVMPDSTVVWQLLDRISPAASWTAPTTLETVSTGAHYSDIQVTNDAHGNLVAYWQQSNGINNNDWAATYNPSPTSGTPVWSTPFQVTDNPDVAVEPTLAVDTNGKFDVAYDHQVPVGSQAAGGATDPTITGLSVAGTVMTSSITPLPELSFTRPMSFPYQSKAASGTQATADAEIINRGPVGSDVTIQFYNGLPSQGGTLLGSQVIHLSAGQSFDVQHAFTVLAGSHVYAIKLMAPGNQEEITTADSTSSASLDGLADLTVSSVTLSDPTPHSGETINVTVSVKNLSNVAVTGSFPVSLTQGNPAHGFVQTVPIGTQSVAGLGALGQTTVVIPWTVPAAGGDSDLSAIVDSTSVIPEAVYTNNDGHADVVVMPEASVTLSTPILVNKSGKQNVALTATVANNGQADLKNVQVTLLWGLDNGPLQTVSTYTIPTLAALNTLAITYDAPGLAGQNQYRVEVDPTSIEPDDVRANNVADQYLVIQGLPDLSVSNVAVSKTPVKQGVPVSITAHVSNLGIAAANNVLVELFDGLPGTGKLLGSVLVDKIAPLTTITVSIPVDTSKLSAGRHQFIVVVNRQETILETSYANNRAGISTDVAAGEKIPPTSSVTLLPAIELNPQFTVSWSGKDNPGGSGIASYDIYESTDGGTATLWLSHTTATSATFTGKAGHSYAFYSIATDNAGNRQATPKSPNTTTKVDRPPTVTKVIVENGMTERSYVDQFMIQFSGPVNVGTLIASGRIINALTLTNLGVNVPTSTPKPVTLMANQFRYNANTFTLTWSLEAFGNNKTSLPDGDYQLTINGSKITDPLGAALDGNGDGLPGGNYTTKFFRLKGDVNGDMKVDASTAAGSDSSLIKSALGSKPGSAKWNANADLNRDGVVNSADSAIVTNNNGHTIVLPKTTTRSVSRSSVMAADIATTQPAFVAGPSTVHPVGPKPTVGARLLRASSKGLTAAPFRIARRPSNIPHGPIRLVAYPR
jgi:hypothetical protein